LAIRCNEELADQISSKSKVPRFSCEVLVKFPEFLFKFYFEYGEISIRKVAPYLKLFPSIFYLEFLELRKSPF
jgi:hypothetical protein